MDYCTSDHIFYLYQKGKKWPLDFKMTLLCENIQLLNFDIDTIVNIPSKVDPVLTLKWSWIESVMLKMGLWEMWYGKVFPSTLCSMVALYFDSFYRWYPVRRQILSCLKSSETKFVVLKESARKVRFLAIWQTPLSKQNLLRYPLPDGDALLR